MPSTGALRREQARMRWARHRADPESRAMALEKERKVHFYIYYQSLVTQINKKILIPAYKNSEPVLRLKVIQCCFINI